MFYMRMCVRVQGCLEGTFSGFFLEHLRTAFLEIFLK